MVFNFQIYPHVVIVKTVFANNMPKNGSLCIFGTRNMQEAIILIRQNIVRSSITGPFVLQESD